MFDNFAITGFGRSGTKFLAQLLNLDPRWTVIHEVNQQTNPTPIFRRFQQRRRIGNYAEVSSFLLPTFYALPVDKKAIILRHPYRIIESAFNRGQEVCTTFIRHLSDSLATIDCLSRDIPFYLLETITSDPDQLRALVQYVGVNPDIVTEELMQQKVNASKGNYVFDKLPHAIRHDTSQLLDWFVDKYYGRV